MLLFDHGEEFEDSGTDTSDTESTESESVAFVGQNDPAEVPDGTLQFEQDMVQTDVVFPSTMATNAGGFGQYETAYTNTPPCPPLQHSNLQPSMTNPHGMLIEPLPWNQTSVQQQQFYHQNQVPQYHHGLPSQNSSTKALIRTSKQKRKSKKKKKKTPETPPPPRPETDRTIFASLHNQRSNLDSIMTKRTDKLANQKRDNEESHDNEESDAENQSPSTVTHVQIGTTKIKLGKTIGTVTKQIVQIAKVAAKLLGEKKQLLHQNKELEQENRELLKENAEMVKAGGKGPKNEAVCKQIRDVCLQKIFRLKKFILDKEDEMKATRAVYDVLHPVEDDEEVDEEAKQLWCDCYCGEVTNKVNYVRTYKQQRMKEAAMVYHKQFHHLPPLEMMVKCALRQIDFKNEDEVRVFMWYWDVLCRKCFAICPLLFAQLVATNIHFAPHSQGCWS